MDRDRSTGESGRGGPSGQTSGHSPREREHNRIRETLRQTTIFAGLPDIDLAQVASSFSERVVSENHQVIRSGDPSDALYVVQQGGVAVYRDQRGQPLQLLARLGPGSIFGEQGLLHGTVRSASVRTTESTRLFARIAPHEATLLRKRPVI